MSNDLAFVLIFLGNIRDAEACVAWEMARTLEGGRHSSLV